MLHHYLVTDLYDNMWSNMFAPSVLTLAAVVLSHIRLWAQRERHQEELKRHITNTISGSE